MEKTPHGSPITAKAIRIANDLNGGKATTRQIAEWADALAAQRAAKKGASR